MGRAMVEKSGSEPVSGTGSPNEPHGCTRCAGLLLSDFCRDVLSSTDQLKFAARHCVQCGEVVDSVIQRNRGIGQESMTTRVRERMALMTK